MIYVAGNFLSKHGINPTFCESLAPKLAETHKVVTASDKLKVQKRLLDMLTTLHRHRKEIDIVLMDVYSTGGFWFPYLLARQCRLYGIPYVPIIRGGNFRERITNSPKAVRQLLGNALRVVSPSLFMQEVVQEAGYKADYIPNFISIGQYPYKERRQYKPKLLWVRSFHKIYNPTMAIEVTDILHKKYPDIEVYLVGPDKDGSMEVCKQLAKEKGLDEHIHFTGRLSKPDWIAISQKADIFFNTTNFDNHPLSVIEAMSLGLPVVSTNVGGLPFLIDSGVDGILLEPEQPQKMADEIDRLIQNPESAHQLSCNARRKVEGFDWDLVKEKWFGLVEEARQKRRKKAATPQ